jgi:ferrous iron transport protein A
MAVNVLPAMAGTISTPRTGSMPLSFVTGGETVTVQEIRGGHGIRRRLTDLGLHQGASIRMIKNDAQGPLIVAVKEHGRLALGRGMAHHILVTIKNSPPR